MDENNKKRRHLYLGCTGKAESYTSTAGPPNSPFIPPQVRQQHGRALMAQLRQIASDQQRLSHEASAYDLDSLIGIQIEFTSFPGIELAVESLADARGGIELTNVRQSGNTILATVFVPDGKLTRFESKLTDYLARKTDKDGKPRDNRALIDAIASFRSAALEALWTDAADQFPRDDQEAFWWEVWLPVRDARQAVIHDFRRLTSILEVRVSDQVLEFPERSVLLAQGSRGQFERSGLLLNCISELRRAKETAAFFDELTPREHPEWADNLLSRLDGPDEDGPCICILDTGANNGNPLIRPFLDDADQFSVDADWTGSDDDGHGTGMAGLAVWGDLVHPLESDHRVRVAHHLESVKVLRRPGDNQGKHHGILTADAVSLAEIAAPFRKRVFALALSTTDTRDRGRPSAWSAALDSLAADALGENAFPRLFTVAGGNTGDALTALSEYPNYNFEQEIHDPGQSWNALTVGAFTEKAIITEPECAAYQPLAPEGGLSPYSTTSVNWERAMPLKPEVVFEGGNVGLDSSSCAAIPSLNLLTTYHRPLDRLFTTFGATSAATALASRFAAEIRAEYPDLWPETVRALMVHSADWTPQMCEQFAYGDTPRKQAQHRVRCVGFGVPDIDRALWSASNSLALIVEDQLQPFEKGTKGSIGTRDMHLHDLPWPKESLQALGETEVELVVTLSYFIEPNPSSRNVAGKYSYASHQLRFDVKRPLESLDAFRRRINREARDAETGTTAGPGDAGWLLGHQFRHKGSIHKDVWKGKAADLAERAQIAVYPAMGWWRTRTGLQRYDKTARYALVISIRVPDVDVDIYNEVATKIQVAQPIALGMSE
ncbi:S8 family peptidase [uncultured Thiocystis sp.]|jgi:hypothetical protein|uniref:S8 family peptidase n=1 Tax=uncultured Thiocystis sp. TaxID=1202134 RepID=UPI0025D4C520|nr:S8 family peptidase [uncultured Thiocystis sp.]